VSGASLAFDELAAKHGKPSFRPGKRVAWEADLANQGAEVSAGPEREEVGVLAHVRCVAVA
jgi:hypothetical protein